MSFQILLRTTIDVAKILTSINDHLSLFTKFCVLPAVFGKKYCRAQAFCIFKFLAFWSDEIKQTTVFLIFCYSLCVVR